MDSITIDLCLSVFLWAEFRKHKGGIKLHTLYDVKTSIPSFLHITTASVHDANILDLIPYETGSFYIVDKGYLDFKRLYRLHLKGSYYVTRAKDNMRFKRMYSRAVDKTSGVVYDQIGRMETYYSRKDYPEKLRSTLQRKNSQVSPLSKLLRWHSINHKVLDKKYFCYPVLSHSNLP